MRRLSSLRYVTLLALLLPVWSCGRSQHKSWTTASGLEVTELVRGEGSPPQRGDIVDIEYEAAFEGGRVFDSTERQGKPYRFRLGMEEMLPGLAEGVATMRVGGKRVLLLPPKLAYGEEGLAGVVPPNTWVRLEVELVAVEPGPPPPEPWNDAGYEIVTLDNGLQYVDFELGEGAHPQVGGMILFHQSGFLDDGTLFDTTIHRPVPVQIEFDPKDFIPGWTQAVAGMREGGRRKVIIPPQLGYGEAGYGKRIPPNATLTYDIELLQVIPPSE